MPVRGQEQPPDRELAQLQAGLRAGREEARVRFYALAHAAAVAVSGRYRHPDYGLQGSADDTGQEFVLHLAERHAERGDDYLADVARAATSIGHLERLLAKRVRWWAVDRARGTFARKLLRRIRNLPGRDPARFAWVERLRRLRHLARVGGPRAIREVVRDRLAARLASAPAGRAVAADYRLRQWIGPNQLADAVFAILVELDGAAAPGPLADVVLLVCGQADTRPPILVGDVAWWERLTDDDGSDEAALA